MVMRILILLILPLLLAGSLAYSAQRDRGRDRAPDDSPREERLPAVRILIRNSAYTPSVLTVQKGQTVVWRNLDNLDHTVTASDGSFSSGTLKRNGSFTFAFAKAGKFQYGCRLHPRMKGMIIVE
jgi:plastocyanin